MLFLFKNQKKGFFRSYSSNQSFEWKNFNNTAIIDSNGKYDYNTLFGAALNFSELLKSKGYSFILVTLYSRSG
jgi:hypothetical protein